MIFTFYFFFWSFIVIHFTFLYSSWGSQGKYIGVVCHSLLQWIMFCQNSLLWPVHLGWPSTAWLIVIEIHKPLCHEKAVILEGDGWHQWINGQELRQTLGSGKGNGSLACCSPWGCDELDMTWRLNNNNSSNTFYKLLGCYMFQMPTPCLMLVFLPFVMSNKEFCVITLCKGKEYAWELR